MYISFDLRRRRRSQTQTHMLTDNYCSGPPQHQNSENVPTCSLLKESRWSPQAQKYQSPLQQLGNTTPASLWSHITDSKVQKWDLTIRVESRLENRDWSQTAAVKISVFYMLWRMLDLFTCVWFFMGFSYWWEVTAVRETHERQDGHFNDFQTQSKAQRISVHHTAAADRTVLS